MTINDHRNSRILFHPHEHMSTKKLSNRLALTIIVSDVYIMWRKNSAIIENGFHIEADDDDA